MRQQTILVAAIALCLTNFRIGYAKPIEDGPVYKDTEEIINDWNNDDSYSYESEEAPVGPEVRYLPPILVEHVMPTSPPTTTTTTRKPVYFPKTDIELGSLFERISKARRNEVEDPVDLPVPYIVWAKDPPGQKDSVDYLKKFYNTMYKVD